MPIFFLIIWEKNANVIIATEYYGNMYFWLQVPAVNFRHMNLEFDPRIRTGAPVLFMTRRGS